MPYPKKPTELHVADGTHIPIRHGSKHSAKDSEYLTQVPPPIKTLCKAGKARWRKICKLLIDAGLLAKRDLITVEAHCRTHGHMASLDKVIADQTKFLKEMDPTDGKIKAALGERAKLQTTYMKELDAMGLNAIGRARRTSEAGAGNAPAKTKGVARRGA